jgi:hypothetical protein
MDVLLPWQEVYSLKEGKVYQIEEKSRISTSDPQVTVNAN